jgi:prepilin-type processing-associated H-X9-DG protein
VFAKAREKARQTQCVNNQKQICLAVQMWSQEHEEKFPNANTMWTDVDVPAKVLKCPSVPKTVANAYVYSNTVAGQAIGEFADLSQEWMIADGQHASQGPIAGTSTTDAIPATYDNVGYLTSDFNYAHNGSIIVGYADGHVETLKHAPVLLRDTFFNKDKSKFLWKSTEQYYRFDSWAANYDLQFTSDGGLLLGKDGSYMQFNSADPASSNWTDYVMDATFTYNIYGTGSGGYFAAFVVRGMWLILRSTGIRIYNGSKFGETQLCNYTFAVGVPTKLRITAQGNKIKVAINDSLAGYQQVAVTSASLDSKVELKGGVGLKVSGCSAIFSDVRVTPL